ncbi:uncharacterized protein EI97DRAFT_132555 [Westerdykella ornata]|uniref:Uncharacterized protein n=1 Tax=Westerdykella ornata TaxID=318751 RepID=A0A6A6JDE9_WESOR|nr:uncharacterized protein EI97DRAFT_132555 [Westerdykella ornata]KAF2274264.1 hypothetical protein EI97DRAFT_132555 [Westerdykella ornata]
MSTSEPPPGRRPSIGASAPQARAVLSAEDERELALLEASFSRIRRSVRPTPYILSTPSLYPYRHRSRQEERAWMMGQRMWEPTEEHLQYRTFLFHDPLHIDCFVSHPGEDYGTEPRRPSSQASNATHSTPKQKLSLSEWKAKQANGAISSGSKNEPRKVEPSKADGASSQKEPGSNPPLLATARPETSLPQKRPATETLTPEVPEKRIKEDPPSIPPPPKTALPSDSPKASPEKTVPSDGTPHGLPPLLSPVDQTFNNPYGLPPILSPTLPSNVQAELDKMAEKSQHGDSDVSASSSDVKNQVLSTNEQGPQRQKSPGARDSRVRSASINGKPSTSVLSDHEKSSERSLIVKLRYGKYGKRLSATIAQLLKLPASRKAQSVAQKNGLLPGGSHETSASSQPISTEEPTSKRSVLPKKAVRPADSATPEVASSGVATKVAEKRPRGEDEASIGHSSKKTKPSQDSSRTPTRQTLSSPPKSNKSSAQKSQNTYSTPLKEHKAVNMLRTASVESTDSTPGRSGITPSNTRPMDPKVPLSASLSGRKQADSHLLSQISQNFNNMGRSLKHKAQNVLTEKGKQLTKGDSKVTSVINLECIISYMVAYAAQDQWNSLRGRPGDVKTTWKTLLPLTISYASRTQDFPHLDGLRHYLCAVQCSVVCNHMAPRGSQYKTNDAPEDMAHVDLANKYTRVTEYFKLLSEKYMQLSREMLDARIKLPIEVIENDYPKTWQGRETNARLAKSPEKFESGNLSGPYFLPIQPDTTPLQAVRFGLAFLKEYCEREKLDYTFQFNLESVLD